jgi:hypothetical protein
MINNLILNHVFNKNFPYSLLLKSFFAFYQFIFENHDMFQIVNNLVNVVIFPWEKEDDRNYWIPIWLEENRTVNEIKRDVATWRGLFTMWYGLLFSNPWFYIRRDPITGYYGIYCRQVISNIISIINKYDLRHGTFLEAMTVTEWEILKELNFNSFIVETNPLTNTTEYFIIFGFWSFAKTPLLQNSLTRNNNAIILDNIFSSFHLKHYYTQGDDIYQNLNGIDCDDKDFIVDRPFRTIVEFKHLTVNRNVRYIIF